MLGKWFRIIYNYDWRFLDSVRLQHSESMKRRSQRAAKWYKSARGGRDHHTDSAINVENPYCCRCTVLWFLMFHTSVMPVRQRGLWEWLETKGASVFLKLFGTTSFSFVTAHLAARHSRNKRRARDFRSIVAGLSSKLAYCGDDFAFLWSQFLVWRLKLSYRLWKSWQSRRVQQSCFHESGGNGRQLCRFY